MLYLGIDQHSKQITSCVRDQQGERLSQRQVSTQPKKIAAFFDELQEQDTDFMAIVEVCGFNDWLIEELQRRRCAEIVLIHPDKKDKRKTDRRDANKLCELLWLNRDRLAAGQRVQGLRRVEIANHQDRDDRQLTALRRKLKQRRTQTINRIHRILHKRNLMWDYPTKTFSTKKGRAWLAKLPLSEIDRLEMDQLLPQWEMWDQQLEQLDRRIAKRIEARSALAGQPMSDVQLLLTIRGVGFFIALTLASRIGDIRRFRSPRSLANYFGLTPGCRNSGDQKHRLGSITKQGSSIVRFVLGQMVIHTLKHDPRIRTWYQKIKRRRGAKIARVAVMRKLTEIIWHMLTHRKPYDRHRLHSGSTKGTAETVAVPS